MGRCYPYGIIASLYPCFKICGINLNLIGITLLRNDNHKLSIVFLYDYRMFF